MIMERIRVFVAVHKEAVLYGNSDCYQFIHVGSSNSPLKIENEIRDDSCSDNISPKNNIYCELTGVYYIWKNIKDIDYVGLCHYRRFLAKKAYSSDPNSVIFKKDELIDKLKDYDILLPQKNIKKGRINGFFKNKEELGEYKPYILMRSAIEKLYPEYLIDFENEFFLPEMSFGNIMICKKSIFDDYCKWLFDILFFVENEFIEKEGQVPPRELGYYSEWLLNIWVRHNKLKAMYLPMYMVQETRSFLYKIKIICSFLGLK